MPNLVGTNLNQVPTNSMLGGLAYQDPEHASIKNLDLKNLSQINSEIADTAVDVFVYDTRKDSDGGAWRKRTQNTSWYNETLGTTTRGTRKEFPAVAVIVATIDDVIIYDGDDPDLPMWMIFESGSSGNAWENYYLGRGTGFSFNPDVTGVAMLNATLVVGKNGAGAGNFVESYTEIDFISDNALHRDAGSAQLMNNSIVSRNGSAGSYHNVTSTFGVIVHQDINDVAMTVLPNAPIDSATGLPVPTIAVATDGGVSVIKDDGNVVQKALTDAATDIAKVEFTEDGFIVTNRNNYHYFVITAIEGAESTQHPSGYTSNINYFRNNANNYPGPLSPDGLISGYGNQGIVKPIKGTDVAMADSYGLNIFNVTRDIDSNDNMVAYITSDYNTGYLHGNIKGAFLSDTDTTNVTGSEKIANYNFAADFSTQWEVKNNANTSYDATNDRVTVTSTQNYSGIRLKSASLPTLTQGKRYIMTVEVHSITNPIRFGVVSGGTKDSVNSVGPHTLTFTAGASISEVFIEKPTGSNSTFVLSAVSIREAEDDRSVNNNGSQVFGTVTKSAVATGAELVAYSGFTASNYLRYNASDMAFGTGDFSVSVWCIPSTDQSNEFILELDDASSSGNNRFYFLVTNTSTKRLYLPWDSDVAGSELTPGEWNHIVVGRKFGYGFVYVNNKWIVDGYKPYTMNLEGNGNGTISNYSAGPTNDYAWSGSLALLRISGSAPSAEQVSKMYHDEKFLFQENAKSTLYGSSDAVTALAFDDTTNLLHVGTSAGRSEFQGLRRINNTTDAVTTAISASNGLVAEQ